MEAERGLGLCIDLIYEKERERGGGGRDGHKTKKMKTHGSSGCYLKIMRALDKRRLG